MFDSISASLAVGNVSWRQKILFFGLSARNSYFGFLIFPAFTSRAFSAAMRFSSSEAGSSFGSCGTSLPRTAKIENETAQAMNGFGRLNQLIEISEKKVDTHRSCRIADEAAGGGRTGARRAWLDLTQ